MRTAFVAVLVGCGAASEPAASPKHILLFLIDDYGFGDASYKDAMYGGKTAAPPTPTLDALAMDGVRLESYYVSSLCSPTRTALLSGRYSYTIGQSDTVIVDGQDTDMPLNLRTIADHFQRGGWNTSAYGKWDAGMTTWGSTPTCRGFDHFRGFYSAASDYFTHTVGAAFDYHCEQRGADKRVDPSVQGVYTTHAVTGAVQEWITQQVAARADAKTFAYVAHEAVHGPLQVPASYINNECRALVPADHPSRLIYCGMVRAMDESVANITATYEALGILNDTLIIVSTDNGGEPTDGGNNYPLRGNKATPFEGGVRGLGFVSGAGLAPSVRGTVSHEIVHVTDWLPTLAGGAAKLAVDATGRACPTCNKTWPRIPPLDGVDQWATISTGAPSARTEVLLHLQSVAHNAKPVVTRIPGSGAIRVGKWKLLHGNMGGGGPGGGGCVARTGIAGSAKSVPIAGWPANESTPWCPFGWTPPPRADGRYELPIPPPELRCASLPCPIPADSGYVAGQTLLFDVVGDPFEQHDVAATNPDVVATLMARLQYYNHSGCGGVPCAPDPGKAYPKGKPVADAAMGSTLVWLPWRGDPSPAACDTARPPPTKPTPAPPTPPTPPAPPTPPTPSASLHSHFDQKDVYIAGDTLHCNGWCWDAAWAGGGVAAMTVRVSVDGKAVTTVLANITCPQLMNVTGAPNSEHGFKLGINPGASSWVGVLGGPGAHRLDLDVFATVAHHGPVGAALGPTAPVKGSPLCFKDGSLVVAGGSC
jgi:arylsulfatase B/arylsulfatase I/J